MTQVANIAGVSTATVSRVINNHPSISTATIKAVRAAMRQVDYKPAAPERRRGPKGSASRGLRTHCVATLLVAMEDSLLQRVTASGPLAAALAEHDLRLMYVPMPDPHVLPPIIDRRHVDGVIVQGLQPAGAADAKLSKMPAVWMMTRRSTDYWADYVEPDNRAIGRLAADYMSRAGHRRVALLNLQPHYPAFFARAAEFMSVAAAKGVSAADLSAGASNESDRLNFENIDEFLCLQVARLAKLKPRPTALFATSDIVLPGLYRLLAQHNIRVGVDLEIITSDYTPVMASALIPSPVCIDIQIMAIAQKAVDQLMWRMANPKSPGPVGSIVPPRLVMPDGHIEPIRP
jgi:LacI family transcriptional regulator